MGVSLAFIEMCVIVNPDRDNVAISKMDLKAGSTFFFDDRKVVLKQPVPKGHRFTIKDIDSDEPVIQYGFPFGLSTGIGMGCLVERENIRDMNAFLSQEIRHSPPETVYSNQLVSRTFSGFKRANGLVGTRNFYLLVPTSQCASETAVHIARKAVARYQVALNFPNVSGIVAIPNTEGCGCANNVQIQRFLRILQNFIKHPNVGGVLIIDLGCEQTNYAALLSYLKNNKALPVVPTDWLTIQKEGGTQKSIRKALDIIGRRLPETNSASREMCPIEQLVVGTECGASDAFSGITANPLIGKTVDKVIYGKGSAILSEVPEMVGAEHILIARMRSVEVANKFKSKMAWYSNLAKAIGVAMSDNLVPENRSGGLINPCIKSLGAIAKGGTTAIEDVLDYGEHLTKPGLHIMQGPGNDMESVTGMVAAGANIVCFSTGKGNVTGSAIVPVLKISSTTELYQRMPGDVDFDAGRLLDTCNTVSLDKLGDALLALVITVASGGKTKSEQNKQGQFQVWTAGKLSL